MDSSYGSETLSARSINDSSRLQYGCSEADMSLGGQRRQNPADMSARGVFRFGIDDAILWEDQTTSWNNERRDRCALRIR